MTTEPYVHDDSFTLYQGDSLEVLKTIADESVQMCVTSPPFYGLRDYGTATWEGGDNPECDHLRVEPVKSAKSTITGTTDNEGYSFNSFKDVCGKCGAKRVDKQVGLEETPEQFVEKLVEIFREVRRVLRRDGTFWLEIGDSYSQGGYAGDDAPSNAKRVAEGSSYTRHRADFSPAPRRNAKDIGLKQKDLIGIPWMLAFALRADGWFLRSDIIWARPNPMPESITDRPTKSHSYIFLLTKRARYYFDQDAIREKSVAPWNSKETFGTATQKTPTDPKLLELMRTQFAHRTFHRDEDQTGRNVRSVWSMNTASYSAAHFATFPEELVERCVMAGTSERGCCPECGAPWVRQIEVVRPHDFDEPDEAAGRKTGKTEPEHYAARPVSAIFDGSTRTTRKTIGWEKQCKHDAEPVPCVVLDPFMGSGTTAAVAIKLGRRAVGVDLNADYCELAVRRALKKQSRVTDDDLKPHVSGTMNLLGELG